MTRTDLSRCLGVAPVPPELRGTRAAIFYLLRAEQTVKTASQRRKPDHTTAVDRLPAAHVVRRAKIFGSPVPRKVITDTDIQPASTTDLQDFLKVDEFEFRALGAYRV